MTQLLEGVTVLDLTRMLAGPYGSMLLADLGAEGVKGGDPAPIWAERLAETCAIPEVCETPEACSEGVDGVVIVLRPSQALPFLRGSKIAHQSCVVVGYPSSGMPEGILSEVAPEIEVDPLEVVGRVV